MLRGTNQLDRKIQIAVLRTWQYGKSYNTVGYAIIRMTEVCGTECGILGLEVKDLQC